MDRNAINMAFPASGRSGLLGHSGREPHYEVDLVTGAKDLIYDPRDPQQSHPYGCLVNTADALKSMGLIKPLPIENWSPALLGERGAGLMASLPDTMLLGPKSLAGGLGMDVCGEACNQGNLGSCVGACGTNVAEDTIRSEFKLKGMNQHLPEISIRYVYFFCQGRHRRPGGGGAMTDGLAATLMTYSDGWINRNYPDMTVDGRCGGIVHEVEFEGVADEAEEVRRGLPYDISACNRGAKFDKRFVELGIKHRCGFGSGDIRRVRNVQEYMEVIASGHVCFTGLSWPGGWGSVDSNGFVKGGLGGQRGGHEIEFCGYIRRRAQSGYGGSNTHAREQADGDDLWSCMKNSWGRGWAHHGYSMMPMSQMQRSGAFGELYAVSFADGWDKSVVLDWMEATGT